MFKTSLPSQSGRLWIVLAGAAAVAILALTVVVYVNRGSEESDRLLEGVLHAGVEGFDRHSGSVVLEDRGIKMVKNLTGKRMVMFAGAVTNHSDRPLDVVQIRLILFNAHEPVFESILTPIEPGPYTPPILSGETRGFTVYLEDFPESWWASRAEMEISGIRFEGRESEH